MSTSALDIQLNPALDFKKLAKEFKKNDRIQIRDVLNVDAARKIREVMSGEARWNIAYNIGHENYLAQQEDIAKMSPEESQKWIEGIYLRARDQFQFFYYSYPMDESNTGNQPIDITLRAFSDYLNSKPFLDAMSELTGSNELDNSQPEATFYNRNNFLTLHNDINDDDTRRYAFVFNFSDNWRPDWGGYLNIYDDNGNIADGFMPAFNTLNIFKTGQQHSVGMVNGFTAEPRLSVSGWFRSKK